MGMGSSEGLSKAPKKALFLTPHNKSKRLDKDDATSVPQKNKVPWQLRMHLLQLSPYLISECPPVSPSNTLKTSDAEDSSTPSWKIYVSLVDWKCISLGSIAMILSSVGNMTFPKIMERAIQARSQGTPTSVYPALAVFVSSAVASYIRVMCFGLASGRLASKLKCIVYEKLMCEKPMSFYLENNVGTLLQRLESETEKSSQTLVDLYASGFRSLNSIIGGSIMLFRLSPKLTGVTVILLPLVGMVAMRLSKRTKGLVAEHQKAVAEGAAVAQERLVNVKTVKLFNQSHREVISYESHVRGSESLYNRIKQSDALLKSGLSLSVNTCLFTILSYGGSLIASGEMTFGSMISFSMYSMWLGLGFGGLTSCIKDAKKGLEASKEMRSLLLTNTSMKSANSSNHSMLVMDDNLPFKGNLTFRNVSFQYPSRPDVNVLDNCSLTVPMGKKVGLIGRSGCGKSTIVDLITQLHEPTCGSIALDGIDTRYFDPHWIRSHIAVVGQEPKLFAMSIAENIRYGCPDADMDSVIQAAKDACCHEFIMEFPDQYETQVGQLGDQLSGGQKQRIAIARALLIKPKLLILDEATSALDAQSESDVKRALKNATSSGRNTMNSEENQTVLIISHRPSALEDVDCVLKLAQGAISNTSAFVEGASSTFFSGADEMPTIDDENIEFVNFKTQNDLSTLSDEDEASLTHLITPPVSPRTKLSSQTA